MTKMFPLVSIITVNYNGKHLLKDCLNSLLALNYPQDRVEIFMVDNGSTDGSIEYVQKYFPKVNIIKNDINNYCRANNLGIKQVKGEYIAFVNNDVKVDRDWLIELINVAKSDKRIGAVTSKILFFDNRINSTGHIEFPNFYWGDRGFKEEDKGQYDKIEEIDSLSHCACLYSKSCFEEVGLLDEDFNIYLEDVDMSIRAKQKGWKLFFCPKSICYHRFHSSIEENLVDFYCERNRLLLIAKHYPEKLAEALFGKGYFTMLNKKSELIKILPDVFIKLIKHYNAEVVISTLSPIFENINKILNLEKDFLIKQLDLEKKQTDLLRQAIFQKDQQLSQKDQLLQQKDQEISNLKNEINQRLSLLSQKEELLSQKDQQLSQKDQLLQQKDLEISHLKEEINHSVSVISQKDQEISNLQNKINQIYDSETYRFIARPIWIFLNFIKRIKSVFLYRRIYHLRRYKKNLCLAYFLAQSKVVKYREPNCYNLKITNDTDEEQSVKIKINIENNNIIYTYFSKSLIIQPKSSMEVIIDYDWQVEAVFYVNDRKLTADELYKRDFDSSGFYSLSAILYDMTNTPIDKLTIFQRLDL